MGQVNFGMLKEQERPITISDFTPNGTSKETKAVLDCNIRLNGKVAFVGLPKTFTEMYAQMQAAPNDPGATFKAMLDHVMENMHIEFYLTPDSPRASIAVDNAKISGFRFERDKGKKDSNTGRKRPPSDVFLWFHVTIPIGADKDAMLFTWRQLGMSVWWEAEAGQGSLDIPEAGKE